MHRQPAQEVQAETVRPPHCATLQTKAAAPYDPMRTARMFGYGFVFYGPLQYYWYGGAVCEGADEQV